MNKHNIKVGQYVYRAGVGRHEEDVVCMRVDKVGRKYFYVQDKRSHKYDLEDLWVREAHQSLRCYATEQDLHDNLERTCLLRELSAFFGSYQKCSTLSLAQVRDVYAIYARSGSSEEEG